MTLGKYISQERQRRGITQHEMAIALGYTNGAQISKKENGHIYWSLRDLDGVAILFDMAPSEILNNWQAAFQEAGQ